MAMLAELQAMRNALNAARYSGQRSVQIGNISTVFATDDEMRLKLDALDADISAMSGAGRVKMIRVSSSKGL